MKSYCDSCASWRMHKCEGCEHFTGVYPPKEYRPPQNRSKRRKNRPSGLKYAKYGLSPKQLKNLKEQQGNKCAICGKKHDLVLDHDHKSDKARGYVCGRCNFWIIGHEDKVISVKIDKYLANPPAKRFYI